MTLSIPGKGVKKDVADATLVFTHFTLPSEVVRDFVLRTLVENLRLEGFRHSEFTRDENMINFRKENVTFSCKSKTTILNSNRLATTSASSAQRCTRP
jgi:hypothetical protein